MLATRTFPEILKISKIKPIHKSGPINVINNYRPIALISTLEKVVEKFMHSRIVSFFDECKVFGKRQYGFRKNSNTTTAIINLITRIQEALENGRLCAVTFLDLSKAFDTISHQTLLNKLYKLGIRGPSQELFESYLKDRSQIVQFDKLKSAEMYNRTGLPQGNIMSPTLYNVYSKDIDELNLTGYIQTFADDKAILYTANDYKSLFEDMQDDLTILGGWLYDNSLTANAGKTKYVVFSYNQFTNNSYNLHLNNQKIDQVDTYKYLGLHLQSNLKWNHHIMHVTKKISSFLGPMLKCANVLSQKTRINLYYSYVYPHLILYNSVWCNSQRTSNFLFKHVQIIQNKFIRTVFKEIYFINNKDQNGNKIIHTADLYKNHNILTLAQINLNESALITHQILHKTVIIDINYVKSTQIHLHNTRNAKNIHLFNTKSSKQKDGFMYKSATIHNSLPCNIRNTVSQKEFKIKLKNFILNSGVT